MDVHLKECVQRPVLVAEVFPVVPRGQHSAHAPVHRPAQAAEAFPPARRAISEGPRVRAGASHVGWVCCAPGGREGREGAARATDGVTPLLAFWLHAKYLALFGKGLA